MSDTIEIENIEEMRRREGIDDVELRVDIRALKAGDVVWLTFLTGATSFEMVAVRITSIRGSNFRGKLVSRPSSTGLRKLGADVPIAFTTAHIHSLLRKQEVNES